MDKHSEQQILRTTTNKKIKLKLQNVKEETATYMTYKMYRTSQQWWIEFGIQDDRGKILFTKINYGFVYYLVLLLLLNILYKLRKSCFL